MALDATVGGASANSYATIAEGDAYAASDLGRNRDAWTQATIAEKEAALIRATDEIDTAVGRVVASYSETQALLFPRYTDLIYGTQTPELPNRLAKATWYQAAFLLRNATVLDDAASFRARGLANFANPDGTSGALADADVGLMHPYTASVVVDYSGGSIIGTIITT